MAIRIRKILTGRVVGGRFVPNPKGTVSRRNARNSHKQLYQFTVNGRHWGKTYTSKRSALKHAKALKHEMGRARVRLVKVKI